MPKIPVSESLEQNITYIGIDPGVSGGLVAIAGNGLIADKMPTTERDVWQWFRRQTGNRFAVIEEINPRPTSVFDWQTKQWVARILKSTCIIYGNYLRLRAMLVASETPFEAVQPKVWQAKLQIRSKEKKETPTAWKNHLKAKAQQLYPDCRVTLAVADAILIAEYNRRKRTGTL